MFEKLTEVEKRYEQVQQQLQRPDVADDQKNFRNLMKELAELEKVVTVFRQYKQVKENIEGSKELIQTESDQEMIQMAKEELSEAEKQIPELEQNLKILLLPKDPNDEKNVILEIRAGAGGDESSLFAEELFRAYTLYAGQKGWSVSSLSTSPGNAGGVKEVIAEISGDKVFSMMKFESGVHRVQRVPKTESQGRVHTSTVTVAVIPEAEEVDVKVDPNDVRVDVQRASGAGGQHVNTTDSAVRLTHIPTGIIVYCQDGKSQHANRDKAFKVLFSRLVQLEEEKKRKEASDERLSQIGTGDRSERIRTYNFPQSRVTDHRIGLTLHSLGQVMQGDMGEVIDPIITHFQAEALKKQANA
ncbi:MAG: peptide chain release factor 1 [Bdellovibrionales bacterium]|nr:peptide chain release factor 1 [Bdellovibrionales bacterium]